MPILDERSEERETKKTFAGYVCVSMGLLYANVVQIGQT